MKTDDVIDKLRAMAVDYSLRRMGTTPSLLPDHVAEWEGYTNILYSHYGEYMLEYRKMEAKILAEEMDEKDEINSNTSKRDEKRTISEMEARIAIRLATLKGNRERLEAELKSATLHINTIQSLLKRASDEAKMGIL